MSAPSDLPTPTAASAPGLLPAPVPLLIRSPSLSGDHAVSVDAGTSIAELKARLADELPLSTRADDMRVIFGGRVVADGEKVGGLGRGEGARVLHVVFRPGALLAKQTSTDNQAAALPKEAAVAAPAPPPAVPEPASELRQRHAAPASSAPIAPTATTSALYPYYYQPMMINGSPFYVPVPNPAYYAAIGQSTPAPQMGLFAGVDHSMGQTTPAAPAPAPVAAAPVAAAAPAAAPALPPPEPDGLDIPPEDAENPWSLLMRLAFLVYLFSQNASFNRVVAMHVVAVIIFLWRTGRFRALRGGWIRRAGQGRGIIPQPEPLAQQQANVPGQPDANDPMDPNANANPAPPGPPERTLLQNVANIAYTFVASLVPQGVEAN